MHFNRGPSGWWICKERRFGSSWKVKSRGVCSIILGTSSFTGSCFCKFILLPFHPFFWGLWKPLARPSDPISLCFTSLIFFLLLWGWQGARQKRWTYPVAPAIRWQWCNSNARRAKVRSWDHLDHQCSVSTWECAMWGLARVVLVAQLPNSMTFKLYQALACLGLERSTIQFPMEG